MLFALRRLRWRTCRPNFVGKTVFITGGSSGIGEALCQDFIAHGAAKVIIAARRVDELERVKKLCTSPERVECMRLDLSEPAEVLKQLKSFFAENKVDILVNNAGMSMRDEFKALDLSICEKIMDLNLMSQIAVTKAVLPQMTKRRSGHIVNVVSGSGKVGLPMRTLYAASKFALGGFGKALRAELSEDNIQVTQFYPGYI